MIWLLSCWEHLHIDAQLWGTLVKLSLIVYWSTRGLKLETVEADYATADQPKCLYSLVTLFPVGSTRAGSTVVGLDDEGVLLLLLAVYGAPGPQHPFSRRPVQHLGLKRGLLPVNLKSTDLSWKKQQDTGGRMNMWMTFFFHLHLNKLSLL